MKIAAAIAADSDQLVGLGRAPRMAVAEVTDGALNSYDVTPVQWDVLHDQPPHGQHHARIVSFLKQNGVEAVLAAHIGQGMVNTLTKMKLPLLGAQGDARELIVAAAEQAAQIDVDALAAQASGDGSCNCGHHH